MVVILTIESEASSARRLGFPVITNPASLARLEGDPTATIRWGNSEPGAGRTINPASAIRLNCNKYKALRVLSKVVKTPEIFRPGRRCRPEYGDSVLVRPLQHSCGEGFTIVRPDPGRTTVPVPKGHYGTAWIYTRTEYRVWFAWDKTLTARRVPLKSHLPVGAHPCRSNWGYRFLSRTPEKLHQDTLAAAKAIGLVTGAADVLSRRYGYDYTYYFVELNSAPTVDAAKIEDFYRGAIQERCASERVSLEVNGVGAQERIRDTGPGEEAARLGPPS